MRGVYSRVNPRAHPLNSSLSTSFINSTNDCSHDDESTTNKTPTQLPELVHTHVDCVETCIDTCEVRIDSSRWLVDACLDRVLRISPQPPLFSTQSDAFNKVSQLLSVSSRNKFVWAIGGPSSGKSFLLFGDEASDRAGIVFRTIGTLFDNTQPPNQMYLLIFMYLIDPDENIVDVLSCCKPHSFSDNICELSPFGATPLCIRPAVAGAEDVAMEIIQLGLKAAQLYIANTTNLLGRYQTVVKLSSFLHTESREETLSSITFIETSSFESPLVVSKAIDRLADTSIRNCSAKTMHEFARTGELRKNSSLLSFLLADSLNNADSIFIGCLRSDCLGLGDSHLTMDFLGSVSEFKQRECLESNSQLIIRDAATILSNEKATSAEYVRRRKAASSARVAYNSNSSDEEDDEKKEPSQLCVRPPWHDSSDRLRFHSRRSECLSALEEALLYPKRCASLTLREMNTLLVWFGKRRIHVSKRTKAFFTARLSEKSSSALTDERPGTSDSTRDVSRPETALSLTPNTPYLQPICSSGYSFPPLCLVIAPGLTCLVHRPMLFFEDSSVTDEAIIEAEKGKSSIMLVNSAGIDATSHCMISRLGNGNCISIEPLYKVNAGGKTLLKVTVNGVQIITSTELMHGDILCFGASFFAQLNVPHVAKTTMEYSVSTENSSVWLNAFNLWERSLFQTASIVLNRALESTADITQMLARGYTDRYTEVIRNMYPTEEDVHVGAAIQDIKAFPTDMFESISATYMQCICEVIIASDVVNFWGNQLGREETQLSFQCKLQDLNRSPTSKCKNENQRENQYSYKVSDSAYAVLEGLVLCSSPKGCWNWDFDTFRFRFNCMRDMHFDFRIRCSSERLTLDKLYPPLLDPWKDVVQDELVGVASLFLGSLDYFFDISETVGIVSFKGEEVGLLNLHLRCSIDQVEEHPVYINIDNRATLSEFIGKKLIIRIDCNKLIDVPDTVSCNLYVRFAFYLHPNVYKSTRYHGKSTSPTLTACIIVEQLITQDFIEFIQRESLDIEVWGRREKYMSSSTLISPVHFVGEVEDELSLSRAKSKKSKVLKSEEINEEEEFERGHRAVAAELVLAKESLHESNRELRYANKSNLLHLQRLADRENEHTSEIARIEQELNLKLQAAQATAAELQEKLSMIKLESTKKLPPLMIESRTSIRNMVSDRASYFGRSMVDLVTGTMRRKSVKVTPVGADKQMSLSREVERLSRSKHP